MWTIIKYKVSEFSILKNSFCKILGDMPEFYAPKIKYEKYINNKLKIFETNILEGYVICKHNKFTDPKFINLLKNSRGLSYFLSGFETNQKDIIKFVKFCKSHENKNGFLGQSFFDLAKKTKVKFISGPFTQMAFDLLENKEKKIKVLMNNLIITVSKNSNNLSYS